jgi:hypothetical protein
VLESILHHIDRLYGLDLGVDIRDFVVDGDTCARLGADPTRGSVLVKQDGGGAIEIGLYLGDDNLERLTAVDLSLTMSPSSFEVLFLAIEEVSHFAYLLFSAAHAKRVTELELELQAEVDKFVTAATLLASRNGGRVPENLLDRLFSDFEPRPQLGAEERARYESASSLASRYCSYVVKAALVRERRFGPLLPELRSFYRLGQGGKIGRIHHVVYGA